MSAVGWTCFVECSSCHYFKEIPKWQEKLPCPHNEEHNCPGTMLWRATGFKWLLMSQWNERAENTSCVCQKPAATLRVCKMSGDALEIGVGENWTVLEAKRKLEKAIGIPAREQCWSFKQTLLHDACLIETLQPSDVPVEVSLALRDPEVALWMERIASDWMVVQKEVAHIPRNVWKSREVILEIMRNSPTALRYADAELFDDASFLLQACQIRGYSGCKNVTPPDSLGWLETIADCKLCLCFAIKLDDKPTAGRTVVHCEHVIAKTNDMDIVAFVVFAFFCDALESQRDHLLAMLRGLSKQALSHGFCSRSVTDLDLARALLPQDPRPAPAANSAEPLLPPLLDSLRAENFALGVLLTHEAKLTSKEFDHFLKVCCQRRDSVPTSQARTLLERCLCRSYEIDHLPKLLTWASQEDYKSFVPFILEKDVALYFLVNMQSEPRAAIFHEVLEFWGGPDRIMAMIQEDCKKVQSLLRWAIDQQDPAICSSRKVKNTLAQLLDGRLHVTGGGEVGKMLFGLCFSAANLPNNISDTIPVEWLKELRQLRGSETFLASTLLMRMEQCQDAHFEVQFPEVWCPVWGSLQEEDCYRAVGLVARWCKLAGLDGDGIAFAVKVLRNLPLHLLRGHALDIIYSPELPAQAGTIYVTKLLQENRKEDREKLNKFLDQSNQRFAKVDQELSKVSKAASEAMSVAILADSRAQQAARAARHAESEAESASRTARDAERFAIARNRNSW